jgi:hypothetical protein
MRSKSREGFASLIAEVSRENEKFLKEKVEESFREVVELVNDAIDYAIFAAKTRRVEEYTTHPMLFFLSNILMPFSCGILTDLLIGNLPSCFYELRVMLESIAKCYVAEHHPGKNLFFENKILSLEDVMRREGVSTSKLLKEFGEMIGLDDEPLKQWGEISQEWIHTAGITDRIVEQVVKKSELPPYALALPMIYSEGDLSIIEELCRQASKFRRILKTTMDQYREEKLTCQTYNMRIAI